MSSILVVDDDSGLASTLQEFLQQEGYAVEVALPGEPDAGRLHAGDFPGYALPQTATIPGGFVDEEASCRHFSAPL